MSQDGKKKKKKINYEEIEKSASNLFEEFRQNKKKGKRVVTKIKADKKIGNVIGKLFDSFNFIKPEGLVKKKVVEEAPREYSFKAMNERLEKEKVSTGGEEESGSEKFQIDDEYSSLVDRCFVFIHKDGNRKGPNSGQFKIKPPKIGREPRKTIIINYSEICQNLGRTEEHLKMYILSELETQGSFDSMRRLVIKGIFYPKDVQKVIKQYIETYLLCLNCRGFKTTMTRDSSTRLYTLVCQNCKSTRTVQSVTSRRR